MTAFTIIWIGQILSLLGTAVSQFGMRFWIFDASGGQATPMTRIGFWFFVPMVLFTPVVGVLVDRANRKLMMMVSDLAAAATTFFVLLLYTSGSLQIWHLYVTAFISGTFQGFQWPAYSAAISTMLDKKHYTRANAMLEMAGTSSAIFAPMIAGALLAPLSAWMVGHMPQLAAQSSGEPGLTALLVLDLVSAAFAIGTLLFVKIPQPTRSQSGQQAEGGFLHQAMFGLRYILARPSLLGLQLVFLLGNLFISLGYMVQDPMILARTGSDTLAFGAIQTAGAIGGVAGSLILGAWGGFTRRVHGVLLGWLLGGLALAAMGASQALTPWLIFAFAGTLVVPMINSSNQAIWQMKVPPDIQGRVFATRRLIAWAVTPVSQLVAGPLADRILEPAFAPQTMANSWLARLFGTGPGAGMGVQLALAGLLAAAVGLGGYLFGPIRDAETLLPDHDATENSGLITHHPFLSRRKTTTR
ncbi:MAG: MFS transporter [Anaerolineae bacterium]|nr:MFS transporter [Anaerolineae bacterium]